MRDPQIYTREDRYNDAIHNKMPDLSKVKAAARNLVLAILELETCELVTNVEPASKIADMVQETIGESLNFDEHEDFDLAIRDMFTDELTHDRVLHFGRTDWELSRMAVAKMLSNPGSLI